MQPMTVEQVAIDSIHEQAGNPRKIGDDAVSTVAESIRRYGWQQPIVVKDGEILVGHVRYRAAKALGLEKVPVIRADHLTAEEALAYTLVDNRTSELTGWDLEKLSVAVGGFEPTDLAPVGFPEDEVSTLQELLLGAGASPPGSMGATGGSTAGSGDGSRRKRARRECVGRGQGPGSALARAGVSRMGDEVGHRPGDAIREAVAMCEEKGHDPIWLREELKRVENPPPKPRQPSLALVFAQQEARIRQRLGRTSFGYSGKVFSKGDGRGSRG